MVGVDCAQNQAGWEHLSSSSKTLKNHSKSSKTALGLAFFSACGALKGGFALGPMLLRPKSATLAVTIIPVSLAAGVAAPGLRRPRPALSEHLRSNKGMLHVRSMQQFLSCCSTIGVFWHCHVFLLINLINERVWFQMTLLHHQKRACVMNVCARIVAMLLLEI